MQLTYRGARYTLRQQPIEIVETLQECRFLGAGFRPKVAKYLVPHRSPQPMRYRLIDYTA